MDSTRDAFHFVVICFVKERRCVVALLPRRLDFFNDYLTGKLKHGRAALGINGWKRPSILVFHFKVMESAHCCP
jgi:hypothetical protein